MSELELDKGPEEVMVRKASGAGQAPDSKWSRSPFHCLKDVLHAAQTGMPSFA